MNAPHDLTGEAKLTLNRDDISGATVIVDGKEYSITSHDGPTVAFPTNNIQLKLPESVGGDVELVAEGGTKGYDFAKYDRPAGDQQQSLVVGGESISNSDRSVASFSLKEQPKTPEIGTTATDKADGDKQISADKQVTITDKVAYKNLTVGKEYIVNGTLMDKATGKKLLVDGKEVTGTKTFTADKTDGYVNVDFTFDASALEGKQIVVFEDMMQDGKQVATHADITDKGQTVEVPNTPKTPNTPNTPNTIKGVLGKLLPNTGSEKGVMLTVVGIILLALLGGILYRKRK